MEDLHEKLTTIFLAAMIVVTLIGCGNKDSNERVEIKEDSQNMQNLLMCVKGSDKSL